MQAIHNEVGDDSMAALFMVCVIGLGAFLVYNVTGQLLPAIIWRNWRKAAIYLLAYLAIGVGYVGIRWTATMWTWSQNYEQGLADWKKSRGITTPGLSDLDVSLWQRHYVADRKIGERPDPLSVRVQTQARRWFVAWPWNALQWALGDLFRTILDWMTNFITKMMLVITDYFTSGLVGLKK